MKNELERMAARLEELAVSCAYDEVTACLDAAIESLHEALAAVTEVSSGPNTNRD